MQLIKCFQIHEKIKQFWLHQICKFYQNITSRLLFMIVFGIHCNFSIPLPVGLKARSIGFFVFYKAKCACPKNRAFLRGFAHPIGIGRAICPELLWLEVLLNQSPCSYWKILKSWSTWKIYFSGKTSWILNSLKSLLK